MSASPWLKDKIADLVRAQLAAASVPGGAIALAIDGQVEAIGVGLRDLDRREPLRPEARFYLYSVTKLLLATAALRLVELGNASLDQPVDELLPDLAVKVPATLRQVLNHTAGLPDYGAMPGYFHDLKTDPAAPWTDEAFLTRTLRAGLLYPPGQGWAYSNVGSLLVRQMIERVTGDTLRDALNNLIFAPLGLRRTAVAESISDARDLTPGYSRDLDTDRQWHDISRRYHPGWVAHGVVISTAPELATILDALFAGQLLHPASMNAMLEAVAVPGTQPPFRCPGYGLGVMTDSCSPFGRLAGHAGGGPGFATAAFHAPDVTGHRITAVALLNRDHPTLATEIVYSLFSQWTRTHSA